MSLNPLWWPGWPTPSTAAELPQHDYSDACPCPRCGRVRRRHVETRTGHATDQGSR